MEEKPIREEESVEYLPPDRGRKIVIGLLILGLCAVLSYAFMEHRSIKQLAASRNELSAALNQQQGQIQTLTQKLQAAETAIASAPAPTPTPPPTANSTSREEAPIAEPKVVERHSHRRTAAAKAHPTEDPWRKQIQSQLTEQQKLLAEQQKLTADQQREIQETKDSVANTRADLEGNLQSTRDDLNGSIAKTHDELVALEKKGERNFYEFSLPKSKQFQKAGPMSVSLRKSNTKYKYCDLVMIVNDSEVSKKHLDLYEPVLFYPEGYLQPLQLVINGIGKDSARGYVSEPRYKPSEVAASASGGIGSGTNGKAADSSPKVAETLKRRPDSQQ